MPRPKTSCEFISEWGRCRQPKWADRRRCRFHADGVPVRVDRYYHRKICEGLLTPVDTYLGEVEIDAMFNGRVHRDGRKSDNYVIEEEQ